MDLQKKLIIQDMRKRRKQKQLRRARCRAVALVTLITMLASSFGLVYTVSANEITLTEINEFTGQSDTTIIKSHASNVEELLADNGVSITEHDKLNIPIESNITQDTDIVITRGRAVTVKTKDGEQIVSITKANAKEALVEAGLAVGNMDEVKTEGNTIELISVTETQEEATETVPFETEYIDDSTMPSGETEVKTEGIDGVRTIVHKVTYKDGIEINREEISNEITEAPTNRVIAKGSKAVAPGKTVATASAAPSGVDTGSTIAGHKYTKKITMTATAYSTHPSENGGYTVSAMGNQLGHGIVAVDPSIVPLGSKVYVEASDGSWVYGVASAEDTGGSIKGNKIDLCYEGTVAEVNQFGRRSCVVYVLE